MERSSRVFTATRPLTSILPPRCMRNVRSETLTTVTSGSARRRSTMACPWASSAAVAGALEVVVPVHLLLAGLPRVPRPDVPAGLADGRGDPAEHARLVGETETDGQAIAGDGCMTTHGRLLAGCHGVAKNSRVAARKASPGRLAWS